MLTASSDGLGDLTWTYSLTNPYQWILDESTDGVTWTIGVDGIIGSGRSLNDEDVPAYYRLWGADIAEVQTTQYSNVAHAT